MNAERNIRLTLQYEGTDYAGWQAQKNAPSIQQTVTEAVEPITRPPRSTASSAAWIGWWSARSPKIKPARCV